ncbi:hypothetical protein BJY24_000277 [Nocardia transvalensis]|uniref:Uncharacterized protein n=1 Tax=Nocardia transvalensis TaxID=37333 RepID=A0A7W9P8P1_9NOCA|nr:hypothetical protein [Nocardia transvalensis]
MIGQTNQRWLRGVRQLALLPASGRTDVPGGP